MKMSIRTRLVAAAAVQTVVLLIAVGVAGYFFLQTQRVALTHETAADVRTDMQQVLRAIGELILSEGSSSSRALLKESMDSVERHLDLLQSVSLDTDAALGRLVKEDLADQWRTVKPLVLKIAERKKVSVDDTDAMILFGKITGLAGKLGGTSLQVVEIAETNGKVAVRTLVAVSAGGVAVLLAFLCAGSLLLYRSVVRPLDDIVEVSRRVAKGDIGTRPQTLHHPAEMARVLDALAEMQSSLAMLVKGVRRGADALATSSAEIAQANQDLSIRTEQQASALAETASAMDGLGGTVSLNAEHAEQANQLAQRASSVAVDGGKVVGQVVETMRGINDASKHIADIITLIDSIAFQTNILALNAAVEAARAGEQGRGFAVVASEVRSLAGRSAAAAKEIKELVNDTVDRVTQGSGQVEHAGRTMTDLVDSVRRVTEIIGEISAASSEQRRGVSDIGGAVSAMDQATQQNAALVEQMAASATGLKQQADSLVGAVSIFKV